MPYYGLGVLSISLCYTITIAVLDFEKEKGIEVFPNPSKGSFSLKLKDSTDKIKEISITNLIGEKVLDERSYISSLNISREQSGIYFVQVRTKKGKNFNLKVIKE